MNMIRSIVAATDLSASARHAADRAARLAHTTGAALALVHAVNATAFEALRRGLGGEDEIPQTLLDDARKRMHALSSDLAGRYVISIVEHLGVGSIVEEIVREADARDADLVVTGTRGTTFMRSHLIGSTAERIVRRSQRAVLMVRQTAHEPYRRALVPVDFSQWTDQAVRLAMAVAPEAMLVLMHAVEVPFEGHMRYAGVRDELIVEYRNKARQEAHDQLRELAQRMDLGPGRWIESLPDAGDAWMQIVQQEQEQDCDLIVIGKHGRGALEELIVGSTTRMVIAEAAGDVLVSMGRIT
jgi:nucleotide-binding universal stress UspA family protein